MARVLNDNVWVDGTFYAVGSTPPSEVAARIGDHAWTEVGGPDPVVAVPAPVGEEVSVPPTSTSSPAQVPPAEDRIRAARAIHEQLKKLGESEQPQPAPVKGTPPPTQGKGSTLQAWIAFAEANGITVQESWTRSDVIAALAAAGITAAE